MKIFIKVYASKTIMLDVSPTDTFANVKAQINAREGIPVDQQILFFCGFEVEDEETLSNLKVQDASTLNLGARHIQHLQPIDSSVAAVLERRLVATCA